MVPVGYVFDGRKMRVARRQHGLSLWTLSARLARKGQIVNPEMLRRWEQGLYEPRLSAFILIAELLRRPPEWFFVSQATRRHQLVNSRGSRAAAR